MESVDYIKDFNLKIFQPQKSYRYNEDSILITQFIKNIKPNSVIADLGAGVGIISLILFKKFKSLKFYPIEIQKEIFNYLEKNIEINGAKESFTPLNMDYRDLPKSFNLFFDVIVSNPPYRKPGEGKISKEPSKAISRHETFGSIEELLKTSQRILKDKGKIYLSFLSERLVDLVYYMRYFNLEPKKVLPVYPSKEKNANLILIEGCKKGGKGVIILPPFFRRDTEFLNNL